jgi:hypothetical protein
MYKLVILIQPSEAWLAGEENWPEFLHMAERMPGLLRESTSQVESFLFGATQVVRMHELFFDSRTEAEQAMASPYGRAAGALLQRMTGGSMTLFFADHKEDDLDNIRKFIPAEEQA